MADYDGTLKLLLRKSAHVALRGVTGVPIEKWLDSELPDPRSLRADLLGETAGRTLVHLELQSWNDPEMAFRMAEYGLGIYRVHNRLPQQFCLYVGRPRMCMPDALEGPGVAFKYTLIDVRELDGEELLASPQIGDNLIAILTRLRDHRGAIRQIATRVAELPQGVREEALIHLYTLAGLRRMAPLVREEIRKMPVYIDLSENEVLGPPYLKGKAEGREEGKEEGKEEGRKDGELTILRRQIQKRFGTLPAEAEKRLVAKTSAELEQLSERLLDAASLDELLS
jgi:predicted transposase YdaD